MDADALRALLDDVAAGAVTPDEAVRRAASACPFADLGYARIDHHRALRQGLPEAVYGPGKTPGAVRRHRRPSCSRNGTGPGAADPGRAPSRPRPPSPPTPAGTAGRHHRRVAAGAPDSGRSGS